jgi:FkbM family methyltransferase
LLVSDFSREISRILAADPASVAKWERSIFDELAAEKKDRLVLCGAGGLGRKAHAGLLRAGVAPLAFADNNPALAGMSVDGVPVLSAREAVAKFGKDSAFVVTAWGAHSRDRLAERKRQWSDLGCGTVISFMPLFWKFAEIFLPHYSCDSPSKVHAQAQRLESLAGLWADDASRAEFVAQLRWRSQLDFDGLPEPVGGPAYFPEDLFNLLPDERFVDCGAYDGDTLGDFLRLSRGEFQKIWALEPDPANFAKLQGVVAALAPDQQQRITLLSIAASDRAQTLRFSADASAASAVAEQGGIEVEGRPLDMVLRGCEPTFIKMDIEGAELSALHGAHELLGRCRPILAICIYHLQEHLWEIPEWLRGVLRDYVFCLRPHDREGWDLVCYAVPRERALNLDRADHISNHKKLP